MEESLPKTAVGKVLRRYLVEEERQKMLYKEKAMEVRASKGKIVVSM